MDTGAYRSRIDIAIEFGLKELIYFLVVGDDLMELKGVAEFAFYVNLNVGVTGIYANFSDQ